LKRILTAVVLLPVFIFAVIHPNPWFFTGLLAAAALLAVTEYFRIVEATGFRPFKRLGVVLTLGFLASAVWPHQLRQEWLIVIGLFMILTACVRRKVEPSDALASASVTFLGTFLVGFLLGYLVALKSTGTESGKDLIFLLAVTVWAGDTLAYYVGKNFGRHPFAPRVSPKKTWEGFFGCVAGSLIAAAAASLTFIHRIQGFHVLVLGLLVPVVGQLGDLCESALKRGAQMKDSSSLLPGHGGMLDRIDSILFNAPLIYYYHLGFLS